MGDLVVWLTDVSARRMKAHSATSASPRGWLRPARYSAARRALELTAAFCDPFVTLPFDDVCVDAYASIRSDLRATGGMIGAGGIAAAGDLLVAATSVAHDLTLATGDTTEFARVPGLRFETWRT